MTDNLRYLSALLMVLVIGTSCNLAKQEKAVISSHGFIVDTAGQHKLPKHDNIHFDFTAKRIPSKESSLTLIGELEITAFIHNGNSDTIYFITDSCVGLDNDLIYDKDSFFLKKHYCSTNYPKVVPIAPKEKYPFVLHFIGVPEHKQITLGLKFYEVDKSFDYLTYGEWDNFIKSGYVTLSGQEELIK